MSNYTNPTDEAFFAAIGRMTLAWGHVELGLDALVDVFYTAVGHSEIDPIRPVAFKRKLDYIKAALKRTGLTGHALDSYVTFLAEVRAASEIRNDVIHGAVVQHDGVTGSIRAVRLVHDKNAMSKREFFVSTETALNAALRFSNLGHRLLRSVEQLQAILARLDQQHG